MNADRRNFLKKSVLASAGTMLVPHFLKALQAQDSSLFNVSTGKRIVVIQLSGGNDGLNTVVPYRNDIYYKLRPKLAIPQKEVFSLDGELGLHPSLKGIKQLYDDGLVSVINNVGYPNPDRSHFRSMDIWQTGSAADEYLSTGWIGRFLDASCQGSCHPYTAIEVDDSLSLALKGKNVKGIAVEMPQKLYKSTKDRKLAALVENHQHSSNSAHSNVDYLYKTMIETFSSAEYIYEHAKSYGTQQNYPAGKFANHLKTVASLINAGADIKVYYVTLSGFDTHMNQVGKQGKLLSSYAEGIKAFVDDLKKNQTLDDTLIMTFSEFGRRVNENASGGTDHGTANNVFLMGSKLKKAGIYNPAPDLAKLDNGDLKYAVDFRSIYATMLDSWLGTDHTKVLQRNFERLHFI